MTTIRLSHSLAKPYQPVIVFQRNSKASHGNALVISDLQPHDMYGNGDIRVGIWNPLLCVLKKDKLVEFLVELGILFFVDKICVAPHVTSLHKSHHNHITTMSQLRVPLFMHMSQRYSVRNSSEVAPQGSIVQQCQCCT